MHYVLISSSLSYIRTSVATFRINITLEQLFKALWFWILEHEHANELELRLMEELGEMRGYCTTGHLARLMSVIQGFTDDENLQIRITNKEQCNSVIRHYLTKKLQECKDEDVLDGMVDGNDEYKQFIRLKVSEKIAEWEDDYGNDFLQNIAKIVNDFARTEVFEIE